MDKGNNTRPYDDLNTIINDKEDEDMEDGEKGEGEGNQPAPPTIPIARSHIRFPNNNNNMNPFAQPNFNFTPTPGGLPPPPPGLFNFHPLHDTTSHENLPPNTFGPPVPAHIPPRGEQGVVKQFDFRYCSPIMSLILVQYLITFTDTIKCQKVLL
jgi:hypothetical protein